MQYVYASRNGNTEKLINKLKLKNSIKINTGQEQVKDDFIIFTYTDGKGVVPKEVIPFLKNNVTNLRGVVATGNTTRHPDTFGFAGDIICKEYNVPLLYKLEDSGDDLDIIRLTNILKAF